jgi:hypothetical protein
MPGDARIRIRLDYDHELALDLRRKLRFYFKEIELFAGANEAHVSEVRGEIRHLSMMGLDYNTRQYVVRKLKEVRAKLPRTRG